MPTTLARIHFGSSFAPMRNRNCQRFESCWSVAMGKSYKRASFGPTDLRTKIRTFHRSIVVVVAPMPDSFGNAYNSNASLVKLGLDCRSHHMSLVDPDVIRSEPHTEVGALLMANVGILIDRWTRRAAKE